MEILKYIGLRYKVQQSTDKLKCFKVEKLLQRPKYE